MGNWGAGSKLPAPLTIALYLSKNRELQFIDGTNNWHVGVVL